MGISLVALLTLTTYTNIFNIAIKQAHSLICNIACNGPIKPEILKRQYCVASPQEVAAADTYLCMENVLNEWTFYISFYNSFYIGHLNLNHG